MSTTHRLWVIGVVGIWACAVGDGVVVPLEEAEETEEGQGYEYVGQGVQAEVSVGPVHNGVQDLTVRLTRDAYDFSSYQGSLEFPPSVAHLERYVVPTTDYHVVNDLNASMGRIRYAGYAVDGFLGPQELVFTFTPQRPLVAGDVAVHFDVLASTQGVPVGNSQLSLVGNMVAGGIR